jgi:hypothetical protein
MMCIAVGAHPGKIGSMMGLEELQAIDIRGHHYIVTIGVLVD